MEPGGPHAKLRTNCSVSGVGSWLVLVTSAQTLVRCSVLRRDSEIVALQQRLEADVFCRFLLTTPGSYREGGRFVELQIADDCVC